MQNSKKNKILSGLITAVFFIWFIMNIRVAAGIGSTFERAVDGIVGIALLVAAVFLTLDFFQVIGKAQE